MPSELSGSYSFNILLVEDNPGDARLAQEAQSEKDIEKSYELNANCFVTKPLDINEFIEVFGRIQNFWLKTIKLPV